MKTDKIVQEQEIRIDKKKNLGARLWRSQQNGYIVEIGKEQ